jgi:hypothetical protein
MPEGKDDLVCSHFGCDTKVPGNSRSSSFPSGWTVGRIEEYHSQTITTFYIYLCPLHRLGSLARQSQLPFLSPGATS